MGEIGSAHLSHFERGINSKRLKIIEDRNPVSERERLVDIKANNQNPPFPADIRNSRRIALPFLAHEAGRRLIPIAWKRRTFGPPKDGIREVNINPPKLIAIKLGGGKRFN